MQHFVFLIKIIDYANLLLYSFTLNLISNLNLQITVTKTKEAP